MQMIITWLQSKQNQELVAPMSLVPFPCLQSHLTTSLPLPVYPYSATHELTSLSLSLSPPPSLPHSHLYTHCIYSHGCNLDEKRHSDHQTALHLAACSGHLGCCKVLVEQGCSTEATLPTLEKWAHNPLNLSVMHNPTSRQLVCSGLVIWYSKYAN